MFSSNFETLLSPREHASQKWKPWFLECSLSLWSRHSCSSISRRRGWRCTHEQRLEGPTSRSIAAGGSCWAVLHDRDSHHRRILLGVLAAPDPDPGSGE